MLIFITGFMGSGKSHLFSNWKNESEGTFADFDHQIAQALGIRAQELGGWIEKEGWKAFRERERELLLETLKSKEGVFSLGGGTLHANEDLCSAIDRSGLRVWLDTPAGTCWNRVKQDSNRPLVKAGEEAFLNLFKERLPLYKSANVSISGTGLLPSFAEFCNKYRDLLKID